MKQSKRSIGWQGNNTDFHIFTPVYADALRYPICSCDLVTASNKRKKKGAHRQGGGAPTEKAGRPWRRDCWVMAQAASLPAPCRPGARGRGSGHFGDADVVCSLAIMAVGTMTRPMEREPIHNGVSRARRLPAHRVHAFLDTFRCLANYYLQTPEEWAIVSLFKLQTDSAILV